jgi:hypothetical protein
MKKYLLILSVLSVLSGLLLGCLNPIGFNPEGKINVDITGKITVDPNDTAWLIVQNNTASLDVYRVDVLVVEEKLDQKSETLVSRVTDKPMAASEKQIALVPNKESEYTVRLWYQERNPKLTAPQPNSDNNPDWDWGVPKPLNGRPYPDALKVIDIACPVRGEYVVHLYRKTDGTVGVARPGESMNDHDLGDTIIGRMPDFVDEKDIFNHINVEYNVNNEFEFKYEGLINTLLDIEKRANYGLLVIKNLTKDIDLTKMEFGWFENQAAARTANITDAEKFYAMLPGPYREDQLSILLSPANWETVFNYGTNQTVRKTSVVSTGHESYLYFYKTKSGGVNVSNVWPPVPNDAHDGNTDPNVICGENEGVLRITNKSSKFIQEIRWGGNNVPLDPAHASNPVPPGGNIGDLVLPAGTENLAFRVAGSAEFGREFSFTIVAQKINNVIYTDDFESEIPPDGGSIIRITNNNTNSQTWVQAVQIEDTSDQHYRLVNTAEFEPAGIIGPNGGFAKIKLTGTTELPIVDGHQYRIDVLVNTPDGTIRVTTFAHLYNRVVPITIGNIEIDTNKKLPGTVKMSNQSDADIIGMDIIDSTDNNNHYGVLSGRFSTGRPVVSGDSNVTFSVYNTTSFELAAARSYDFWLLVERGGERRSFNFKTDVLYDATVAIDLTQPIIDALDPPLPPRAGTFMSVTGVTNLVTEIDNGTPVYLRPANFIPATATAILENKAVKWEVDPASDVPIGSVILDRNATLNVAAATPKIPTNGGSKTLKLIAVMENAVSTDNGVTRTDYRSDTGVNAIVITVIVKPTTPPASTFKPVQTITGIPAKVSMGVKKTFTVAIEPGDTTSTAPIQWSVDPPESGTITAGGIRNTNVEFTAKTLGQIFLVAKIADGKNNSPNSEYLQRTPVVSELVYQGSDVSYVGVRIKYVGNPVNSNEWHGNHRSRYFEVIRRPPLAYGGKAIDDKGSTFQDGNIRTGKSAVYWAYNSYPTANQNVALYLGNCQFSIQLPQQTGKEDARDGAYGTWTNKLAYNQVWAVNRDPSIANYTLGTITQPDGRTHNGFFEAYTSFLAKPMQSSSDAPLEFWLPVKHSSDTSNRKSTVYWLRAGTDQNQDGWGRTWQAWTILEWFAIDIDAVKDYIGRDGFIEIGLKCYGSGNGDREMAYIAK